jgi:DNA sulfur modification protein DndE
MIENVRISEKAKNQLITLKRRTGIQNWNTLCRWGPCASRLQKTQSRRTSLYHLTQMSI